MTSARGTITSRLLVNATVDPDEAATRLPDGLRPRVTTEGTVVGCCLLDSAAIRPAGAPAAAGRRLRAAAHRISVEWTDRTGATVTGVCVLARHTDSRLAILLGGRWFPGIHQPAVLELRTAGPLLSWSSVPDDPGHAISVTATIPAGPAPPVSEEIAAACLGATVALSPGRRQPLEAARMETAHHRATTVVVEERRSAFIDGFSTARPAASFLMRDVDVVWSTARESIPASPG